MEIVNGTVEFFNELKLYGFIHGEDGLSYFVHISEIQNEYILKQGDKVKFIPTNSEKGMRARDVQLVD